MWGLQPEFQSRSPAFPRLVHYDFMDYLSWSPESSCHWLLIQLDSNLQSLDMYPFWLIAGSFTSWWPFWQRSSLSILPVIISWSSFPCRPHGFSPCSFCLHQDSAKLACSDLAMLLCLALVICTLTFGSTCPLIAYPHYVFILHTVLAIASRKRRLKALEALCLPPLYEVLVFLHSHLRYTMSTLPLWHLPLVHVFMGNIYILFHSPMMNPIIYSIKTNRFEAGWRSGFSENVVQLFVFISKEYCNILT